MRQLLSENQSTPAAAETPLLPGILQAGHPDAQTRFNEELQQGLARTVWADPGCTSWYKNAAGRITQHWHSHTRDYAAAVKDIRWRTRNRSRIGPRARTPSCRERVPRGMYEPEASLLARRTGADRARRAV